MALSREVKEGLGTFVAPFRLMNGAGLVVAAICLVPAIFLPNKTVAEKFTTVGINSLIVSLLAGVPSIAIGSLLLRDEQASESEEETQARPSTRLIAFHQVAESRDVEGNYSGSGTVELFQQLGSSVKKPAACAGCQHYEGTSYGGNRFVCAMHLYGWDLDTTGCPDWEGQRTSYRIVRIQGADRPALYLIKDDAERSLCELVRCGCLISGGATTELLCKRYRLKSPNGLPGCRFDALSDNPLEALNELIGSCLTE